MNICEVLKLCVFCKWTLILLSQVEKKNKNKIEKLLMHGYITICLFFVYATLHCIVMQKLKEIEYDFKTYSYLSIKTSRQWQEFDCNFLSQLVAHWADVATDSVRQYYSLLPMFLIELKQTISCKLNTIINMWPSSGAADPQSDVINLISKQKCLLFPQILADLYLIGARFTTIGS